MTRDEIIASAQTGGFDVSGKTDAQLLTDHAFFRAAFGSSLVADGCGGQTVKCECGRLLTATYISEVPAWLDRFKIAAAALDAGDTQSAFNAIGASVVMRNKEQVREELRTKVGNLAERWNAKPPAIVDSSDTVIV